MIVIGLMSGTSADGTDACAVRIEGAPPALTWEVLSHTHTPHPPALRQEILQACSPDKSSVELICRLNFRLGQAFGQAAISAIHAAGLSPHQVDLIGSHGQTVWHIPTGPQASTLQIGEPAVIAELTGVPVVSNFRTRDVAAGGQGAPLVAYVDSLLFTHPHLTRAAQNIGGIANVTYLPAAGSGPAFAFDTGPGNMLLDWSAARATAGALNYDQDGALAAQGQVHPALLQSLLDDLYLRQAPPKTTGRERYGAAFAAAFWERAVQAGLSHHDILATLTAFTVESIRRAYHDFLPRFPDEVILSGGGAQNPVLVQGLRQALAPARILLSDELGLGAEAKEAVAFAVLAYETWHGRPSNLPAATGAARPVILGNLTPAMPDLNSSPLPPQLFIPAVPAPAIPAPAVPAPAVPAPAAAPSGSPLLTEAHNPATADIDTLPTLEMVQRINAEDARVPLAVAAELPHIAAAIDAIAARMQQGGRLIYIGAGTSGRLGILDAAECPPTFGTSPDLIVARIAGGPVAITDAVEGAEDDAEAGQRDLQELGVSALDSVVGIAASGTTRYVVGGLEYARQQGCLTVSLACNRPNALEAVAEINITPITGPEVIAGSTRMKAGTAQKLVLNMLSSGVMIKLGKTFGNLMVDVRPTNAKLKRRALRIVAQACEIDEDQAAALLEACDGEVKTAIVAHLAGLTPAAARLRLKAAGGAIRRALSANHNLKSEI